MLVDELREKLKNVEPDIEIIKHYWEQTHGEEEFQKLNTLTHQENFWQNPDQAKILKTLQRLKTQKEAHKTVVQTEKDLFELLDLFAADEKEIEKLREDVGRFVKTVTRLKLEMLLSDPQDDTNCFLSINSGAGGTESQDWSDMLLRMYLRFCEREKLHASVIDYQPGEGAGIKSATLFIQGKNAYGLLKGEHGIHRLVRISPFDANKRRHTSFAGVFLLPEVEESDIVIDPKDLRIDTYRAGGAGGQHVNKTDSAVRITHLPTNIVVQCQNDRSQIKNKETAMKMLMAKLKQKQKDEKLAKVASIEKKSIEWGSQIRSYVLHPYKMVKDHRTDMESPQPELVLDGELMPFIEKQLVAMQSK